MLWGGVEYIYMYVAMIYKYANCSDYSQHCPGGDFHSDSSTSPLYFQEKEQEEGEEEEEGKIGACGGHESLTRKAGLPLSRTSSIS